VLAAQIGITPGGTYVTTITDAHMKEMLALTRTYCVCILRGSPDMTVPSIASIVWEHGRRNFALRADGVLSIVCPISDGSGVSGVAVFNASVDEVKRIMDDDPGVKAGIFTYELHSCRSFPGSSLPK
jgi:hypothetical protein